MKQSWAFQGRAAQVVWKEGRVVDVIYGPASSSTITPPLTPPLPPKHPPMRLTQGKMRETATSLIHDGYTADSIALMMNIEVAAVRRLLVTLRGMPGVYTAHGQKETPREMEAKGPTAAVIG